MIRKWYNQIVLGLFNNLDTLQKPSMLNRNKRYKDSVRTHKPFGLKLTFLKIITPKGMFHYYSSVNWWSSIILYNVIEVKVQILCFKIVVHLTHVLSCFLCINYEFVSYRLNRFKRFYAWSVIWLENMMAWITQIERILTIGRKMVLFMDK